jgi:hypothetical protein
MHCGLGDDGQAFAHSLTSLQKRALQPGPPPPPPPPPPLLYTQIPFGPQVDVCPTQGGQEPNPLQKEAMQRGLWSQESSASTGLALSLAGVEAETSSTVVRFGVAVSGASMQPASMIRNTGNRRSSLMRWSPFDGSSATRGSGPMVLGTSAAVNAARH